MNSVKKALLVYLGRGEITFSHIGFLFVVSEYENILLKWKDLAGIANCSERKLQDITRDLEEYGFIIREQNQRGLKFKFTPDAVKKKYLDNSCQGSAISSLSSSSLTSKKKSKNYYSQIKEIIADLNEISGKDFRASTKSYQVIIIARLNEGASVKDFKKVHRNKQSWVGDPKMGEYFRPSTLYAAKHFNEYLNSPKVVDKDKQTSSKWKTPEAKKRSTAERTRLKKKLKDAGIGDAV